MDRNRIELDEPRTPREAFVLDKTKAVPPRTQPFLVEPVDGPKRSFTTSVPKSDLLSRLSSFLPELKRSNESLRGRRPEDIDIEAVPEGAAHIQMDLGLGVFERRDAGTEAGMALPGQNMVSIFGEDTTSGDDSDSPDGSHGGSHDDDGPSEQASDEEAPRPPLIEEI